MADHGSMLSQVRCSQATQDLLSTVVHGTTSRPVSGRQATQEQLSTTEGITGS